MEENLIRVFVKVLENQYRNIYSLIAKGDPLQCQPRPQGFSLRKNETLLRILETELVPKYQFEISD